jgi:hypothetical protein
MARGDLRLTVEGIGRFRITDGERIGWQRADAGVNDQDIRTFLLGSAVGALLIQRGMLVLHGNALEKDGQAIVCLGHSGAGKSTLAYALMQQGWRLLADDLVAVNGEGMVLPGIPRIKLWHDAAKAFGLDPGALPPIREGMNKYLLMGEALQRAPQAAALQVVYLIHQQRHGEQEEKGATIRRIQRQQAATLRLRNQAFRPRFVRGLGQRGPTSWPSPSCSSGCPWPPCPYRRESGRCSAGWRIRICSRPPPRRKRAKRNRPWSRQPHERARALQVSGQLPQIRQHLVPGVHHRAAAAGRPRHGGDHSSGRSRGA